MVLVESDREIELLLERESRWILERDERYLSRDERGLDFERERENIKIERSVQREVIIERRERYHSFRESRSTLRERER